MGSRATSARRRFSLRRERELLSMTAGVEVGSWFMTRDQTHEETEALRVWDGVRRELITYALQPAEQPAARALLEQETKP